MLNVQSCVACFSSCREWKALAEPRRMTHIFWATISFLKFRTQYVDPRKNRCTGGGRRGTSRRGRPRGSRRRRARHWVSDPEHNIITNMYMFSCVHTCVSFVCICRHVCLGIYRYTCVRLQACIHHGFIAGCVAYPVNSMLFLSETGDEYLTLNHSGPVPACELRQQVLTRRMTRVKPSSRVGISVSAVHLASSLSSRGGRGHLQNERDGVNSGHDCGSYLLLWPWTLKSCPNLSLFA